LAARHSRDNAGNFLIAGQEGGTSAFDVRIRGLVTADGDLNWMQRYDLPQWAGDDVPGGFACLALPKPTANSYSRKLHRDHSTRRMVLQTSSLWLLMQCSASGELLSADTIWFWARPFSGARIVPQMAAHYCRTNANAAMDSTFDSILIMKLSAEGSIEWWNTFRYSENCVPTDS